MKKNGNWLIALDLTKADNSILEYVRYLDTKLKVTHLTFVHVSREPRRARLMSNDSLNYDHIVNEELRLLIKASVRAKFDLNRPNISVLVRTGEPLKEILLLAAQLNIDTIFLGKKKESRGSGVISDKLVSVFESDVLLVPEGFEPRLGHVLISTDFSNHASKALLRTMDLKETIANLQVTAFNSFDVPAGYSKTGNHYGEVEEIMRGHSEDNMKTWLHRYGDETETILSSDRRATPMQQLLQYISENPVDLLVLGSKGHTELSRLILGSNAWRVILGNRETPLLIVKKENEPVELQELVACT